MSSSYDHSAVFTPQSAAHFDLVNKVLNFIPEELQLLEQNGFLLSDRLAFEQFKRAYAFIYRNDLPVLITTDSILHAIHQTYDKLLVQLEMNVLTPMLITLLSAVREHLSTEVGNVAHEEKKIYQDLDLYLTVPLALLNGHPRMRGGEDGRPEAKRYLELIWNINSGEYFRKRKTHTFEDGKIKEVDMKEVGREDVEFFGLTRPVDFTLFQARGHYTEPIQLTSYFATMMWLALIDFRLLDYDPFGKARVHKGQLAAAYLLRNALDKTGQRETWQQLEHILSAFVGWSDNVTLNGLDSLFEDARLASPADCLAMDESTLMDLLLTNDYGHQRIRGQGQYRARDLKKTLPHAVSFCLIGQRFTVESYVMGELVFDKLAVNGQLVKRAFPSPFDVMAALGNERAVEHLQDEFERYGYRSRLMELRQEVRTHSHEFWENSFYNLWLRIICTLHVDTTATEYPSAMRSKIWADKMLHTQLGSWTQLRHDNILYVKPPFEPMIGCEYPVGYVEPYPAFYSAVRDYARFGQSALADFSPSISDSISDQMQQDLCETLEQVRTYFRHLGEVALTLEQLSKKELAGEAFSDEEIVFLRSVVVRKYVGSERYGGYTEEDWDGWYNNLLPFGDDNQLLVTDIYTNTNADIGTPGVLHLGLGMPIGMALLVESGDSQTMYVGPTFAYFEHFEPGVPPHRLTDEEWAGVYTRRGRHELDWARELLNNEALDEAVHRRAQEQYDNALKTYEADETHPPMPPNWTRTFRLFHRDPIHLYLPEVWSNLGIDHKFRGALNRHFKIRSLGEFLELVKTTPQQLLQIDGFDKDQLETLLQRLREVGYFNE